jgi:hypothetical protein
MSLIKLLKEMRNYGGPARTTGLTDEVILHFAEHDSQLKEAVEEAYRLFTGLSEDAKSGRSSPTMSIFMQTTPLIPLSH